MKNFSMKQNSNNDYDIINQGGFNLISKKINFKHMRHDRLQ